MDYKNALKKFYIHVILFENVRAYGPGSVQIYGDTENKTLWRVSLVKIEKLSVSSYD